MSTQAALRPVTGRDLVIALLIAACALALFGRIVGHEFLDYDDRLYVTANEHVQAGLTLRGVAWAFTTNEASNYWHPLTWLSHMLDCQIFGVDPRWHHLTNLLLHALNGALLYLLLRRMTGSAGRSASVALLFALHPLHVESAAWIAERKDLLSTLFWILATMAYVRYAERPSWGRMSGVAVLFALGLLSKPMLVTFPFTLLILDVWPLGRAGPGRDRRDTGADAGESTAGKEIAPTAPRGLLTEKIPLFALTVLFVIVNIAIHPPGAIANLERLPLTMRLANAVVSYSAYLLKMFVPVRLAVLYPLTEAPGAAAVLGSVLLIASITVAAIYSFQKRPWIAAGWFWYLGTLVPVIGVLQVGSQAMADRYTYMPLVGIFIAIVWTAADVLSAVRAPALVPRALTALVLGVCALLSWRQLGYWKNSRALFEHTLAVTKNNWVIQYNMGCLLEREGDLAGAATRYEESVRINPGYLEARNNLGGAYQRLGRNAEAIAQFRAALSLDPRQAIPLDNLGWLLAEEGDLDGALAHYQQAMRLAPDDREIRINLARVQIARGDAGGAAATLEAVLASDPTDARARDQLAIAYTNQGRPAEAAAQFRRVLEGSPDDPDALNGLAWILATCPQAGQRNGAEAVTLAERASTLRGGGDALVLDTLAAAYAEAGRFPDAVGTLERALALIPSGGSPAARAQFESRLALYRSGAPFRDSPSSPSAPR